MIPPDEDAAFVACMENILDLYQQPLDPRFPVVNMDEQSVQLLQESRVPLPGAPGRLKRVDHEYRRNGTASLFVFTEALSGWATGVGAGATDSGRLGRRGQKSF